MGCPPRHFSVFVEWLTSQAWLLLYAPCLSDTFLQPLWKAAWSPQRLFHCLKSLRDKTHVCLSPKTPLFMLGVSLWLWAADFTLNVTLSEKHSSTILSISRLCLPARSVSFNISTSLFGGFFSLFKWGEKDKKNLWSDFQTFLLNLKHAQSADLKGGFSKFHCQDSEPGLTRST